jgi:hypothetical protein
MGWHGWLWVDDAWERVCTAPTIGECARALGVLGEGRGVPTRHQALTSGTPPSFRPTPSSPKIINRGTNDHEP